MKYNHSFQNIKAISATFLMSAALLLGTSTLHAATATEELQQLQKSWAQAMYNNEGKKAKYTALQKLALQANKLSKQYPNNAALMTWDGIVLSSFAGAKGGMGALSLAKEARIKLEKAQKLDSTVLNGSVFTSLATLYSKVPGWPIGFGNDAKAKAYFTKALTINPHGIDPNYFYAEYLVKHDQEKQAISYLQKALNAPARPDRPLADAGRKQEVQTLLTELTNG